MSIATGLCRRVTLALSVLVLAGCAQVLIANPNAATAIPVSLERLRKCTALDISYDADGSAVIRYLTRSRVDDTAPAVPTCDARPTPATHVLRNGVWIWDADALRIHDRTATARLARQGLTRVYLQVGGDLAAATSFLNAAHARGIEVFALDGDPSDVNKPGPLRALAARIRRYNATHAIGFAGLQLDVEPYLLLDYDLHPHRYQRRYLALLDSLRADIRGAFPLGVAIPFWFDDIALDGRSLADAVVDEVDEVNLMTYRTRYAAVLAAGAKVLCYAAAVGKPVRLGLELGPIADRRHFIVSAAVARRYVAVRASRAVLTRGPLDGLPVLRYYETHGSRISFFRHPEAVAALLARRPPYASFAGYVLDGYSLTGHYGLALHAPTPR